MKIAFLTPEFLTECDSGGGIGNYVFKISMALKKEGHYVEIFVLSKKKTEIINFEEIPVHRIPFANNKILVILRKSLRKITGETFTVLNMLFNAWVFRKYFMRRNKIIKFDLLHSANWHLSGFFIPRENGFKHFLRLSDSRILWDKADGKKIGKNEKIIEYLTKRYIKKVDFAFAPSNFLAKYYSDQFNLQVRVIRPPLITLEKKTDDRFTYPKKFLIHFASTLGERKGTIWLSKTLNEVYKSIPDFTIIFAGRVSENLYLQLQEILKENINRIWFIQALEKEKLYTLIGGALASVLPSIVDNIPNTVLESLSLSVPVIGTKGASIDEIVEDGISGRLVEINNTEQLKNVLINVWERESLFLEKHFRKPEIFDQMCEEKTVHQLLMYYNL